MYDWDQFLLRLKEYPPRLYRVRPPCPSERMDAVERELGAMPATLKALLERANGMELFIACGPMDTLLPISTTPPFKWAPDWYIERYTPVCRKAGLIQQDEWAFGISSYGSIYSLNPLDLVKEWDVMEARWLAKDVPIHQWVDDLFKSREHSLAKLGEWKRE